MRLRAYWATGLLGGRPPQPGVATELSVLAWQLCYVDVFYTSYRNKPLYILPKQTTQNLTLQ